MKNFYLIPNLEKEDSLPLAEKLCRISLDAGGSSTIFLPEEGKDYPSPSDVPEDTEAILVLGGDGTMIHAAVSFLSLGLPILGVNTGRVGFLTGIDGNHAEEAMEKLLADDFREESRLLLGFSVYRGDQFLFSGKAMNDVAVLVSTPGKTLELSLLVNGTLALSYTADGMILSTPSGSTAYNLSAGGPIVCPGAETILATPLNPHSFLSRSMVLPADARAVIRLSGGRTNDAGVYYDSFSFTGLRAGDEVRIGALKERVRLIDLRQESFFETLRNKISL